jgi:SulP family sulfate permease
MKISPVANSLLIFTTVSLIGEVQGWTRPKSLTKKHPITQQGIFGKNVAQPGRRNVDNNSAGVQMVDSSTVETRESSPENKLQFPDSATLLKASTSGLAVSLAMMPEAIAFAFVAGVNPLVGLWTTVVLGFTAAALGGRAGICSSASGACSVVVAALCASHGPAYLSACAVLAGILQIGSGLLGVGKFITLVPHPVMLGFVNGLAMVMTRAQLVHFQTAAGNFMSVTSSLGSATYGIAALTMVLVKLLPKVTKVVPPTLGAVTIASVVAKLFSIPAKTLADVAGASTFAGGFSVLPKLGLPNVPMTLETLQVIFPYAAIMASVGVLESLLTMQLLDNIADDGTRGSTTKECVGQGSGNILAGLTGGIGGCALLGQSIINMQSGGGVSRWSGMSMALFLALGIVAGAPLLANIPVASLVGVMLLVCHSTFSWSSLRLINKIPKLDVAVIALVSLVTVKVDLAAAVLVGTITSALGFAYKQSRALTATLSSKTTAEKKFYDLKGPLFFGSTRQFDEIFSPKTDPDVVVVDFSDCRIMDHSAVDALQGLTEKYTSLGKTVLLQGISMDGDALLQKYCKGLKSPPFQAVSSGVSEKTGVTTPLYQAVPTV